MISTSRIDPLGPVLLVALTILLCGSSFAAPPPMVEQRESVVLHVHPLSAGTPAGAPRGPYPLPVNRETGGSLAFDLLWPDAGTRCSLKLDAVAGTPTEQATHPIQLRAELILGDGTKVQSARSLLINDGSTTLFEVYRQSGQSLTLVLEAEITREMVVGTRPRVGRRVGLKLEVQRVRAGNAISLETNELNTFVGLPVAYSFSLGETSQADALRIELKPVRISGDIVEIDVELSGTLPADEAIEMVGRRESVIASRGAPTIVAVESGDPPTGYRFVVTAQF